MATELFPFNTAGDVSLEKPPNNSLKGTVYPLSHLIPIPSYPFTSGICMVPCSRIFLVTVLSLAMITNANNLTTCKSLVIRQIVDSHGQSNISIPTKAERSSKCAQTSARREYPPVRFPPAGKLFNLTISFTCFLLLHSISVCQNAPRR